MYSDFTCCIYIYIIYMIKNVRTVVSRFTNCRRKAFLRIPRTLPDLVVHLTSLGSKIHVCEAPSDEVRTNALPSFRLTSGWSFLIRLWMKKRHLLISTPCPLDLQVPLLRFTRLPAVWWFGGMSSVRFVINKKGIAQAETKTKYDMPAVCTRVVLCLHPWAFHVLL